MNLLLVGLHCQFVSGKFVQFYSQGRGVQFDLSYVDQGHGMAAHQKRIGEGHVGLSQDADGNVLNNSRFQAVQRQVERRICFLRLAGVVSKDSHGGIPALNEKPKGIPRVDSNLLIKNLVIEIHFFMPVLYEQLQIIFGGIFDADNIVIMFAIFKIKRVQFKMISEKVEFDLLQPQPVYHILAFKFQSCV